MFGTFRVYGLWTRKRIDPFYFLRSVGNQLVGKGLDWVPETWVYSQLGHYLAK